MAFEDHCSLTPQKLNAIGISKVYMLTLDTSKEISMFAGTALHANDTLKNYHFEENLDFIMIRPIGLTRVFEVFHGIAIINTFVKISHKIPIDRNLTVEDCTYCTTYP